MTADCRVLFFGDSFVAGVGDPEARGWVGRVAAASAEADLAFLPYVLGVRRETSVQVAARWLAEARPRMAQDADCRVVFSFGANDATAESGSQRVEPGVTLGTLRRVLGEAAGMALPVFVVGPGPVGEREPDLRIAELTQRMGAVCEQREVAFAAVAESLCGCASWTSEAAAGDGAHPGAGGYDALARLVLKAGWLDWLRKP
ncbi:MAG: GDSL-type esterase/lipase family protein [Solirubrobacteraceae bacterium]